ncbi:AAA family ATPase [Niveispirillum sp.]|uniref:ATP-binding protein n=1 Tax=Niveispirillum sp. TaxID=1917217 RepID=UPI001B3CABF6|nr:adenylate/guanylate cyclase domain-containing protein [Niveispirillum sp.]MBP7339733.1 AAA family ATPase [Niveispirillum sp.]
MVTAFFCDIVNSSQMVIPQDPEDAYDQLSGLIDIMRRHVTAFGGTICQTLGDGIYAVFGAPVAQEDHAVRACFAADGIVREVSRGGRAVRVGMASGEVLWDHDVADQSCNPATGATVHIAAKLQQLSTANRALMSDSTARQAADWVETQEASLVVLGGDEPLQTHLLSAVRTRRRQCDDALPIVGRGNILSYLLSALKEMADGGGGFGAHLIQAAPGLGKTRLVRSLAGDARAAGARVLEWQVPAVEPVGAQGPLHQLVTELLDGPIPRTPDGLSAMLRAAGAQPEEADALSHMLLPVAADSHDRGTGAVLSLAAGALAALVRSAADRRPVLLVVEDTHWADTAVQATLSALLGMPASTRLLLVMTSREEGLGPAITGHRTLRHHKLGPLNAADTSSLLDHWMGRFPGLAGIKADLARRARGNPFFLVECIRVLMMNGTLLGDVGDMRPGEMPAFDLPDSVQSLLSVRIDMLDEEARRVLRTAAVVGQTFDSVLLSKLIGGDVAARRLPDLVRSGLIDETRLLPRQEFSFHHALLHEAVYSCVTRRDRRQLHGRLAELLALDDFADLSGRLAAQARHAAAGELWPLAVRAGVAAGREALNRSLAVEAVSLLSIAVESNEKLTASQDSLEAGIDLRIALAKAAMPAGMGERAIIELDKAVTLARRAGDESRAMVGLVQQINYEWVYGNLPQALMLADSAISYSGGERAAHPELLIIAASCRIENDEPDVAMRLLDMVEQPASRQGHVAGRYTMLDTEMMLAIKRARCLSLLHRDAEADGMIQQAIRCADSGLHLFNRVFARSDAAEIRLRQRRYADVLGYSSECLTISRSTGSTLLDAVSMARRGLALAYLGRGTAGLVDIDQGLRIATMRGAALHVAKARLCRAVALALVGQSQAAQKERAAVAALADERGYRLLTNQLPGLTDLTEIAAQARSNLNLLSLR